MFYPMRAKLNLLTLNRGLIPSVFLLDGKLRRNGVAVSQATQSVLY